MRSWPLFHLRLAYFFIRITTASFWLWKCRCPPAPHFLYLACLCAVLSSKVEGPCLTLDSSWGTCSLVLPFDPRSCLPWPGAGIRLSLSCPLPACLAPPDLFLFFTNWTFALSVLTHSKTEGSLIAFKEQICVQEWGRTESISCWWQQVVEETNKQRHGILKCAHFLFKKKTLNTNYTLNQNPFSLRKW